MHEEVLNTSATTRLRSGCSPSSTSERITLRIHATMERLVASQLRGPRNHQPSLSHDKTPKSVFCCRPGFAQRGIVTHQLKEPACIFFQLWCLVSATGDLFTHFLLHWTATLMFVESSINRLFSVLAGVGNSRVKFKFSQVLQKHHLRQHSCSGSLCNSEHGFPQKSPKFTKYTKKGQDTQDTRKRL